MLQLLLVNPALAVLCCSYNINLDFAKHSLARLRFVSSEAGSDNY